MPVIRSSHPFAQHLGVALDGQVLRGKAVVEIDTDAGTVLCRPVDFGKHTGDPEVLTGTVRLYPMTPLHTIAEILVEYPEFTGILISKPNS